MQLPTMIKITSSARSKAFGYINSIAPSKDSEKKLEEGYYIASENFQLICYACAKAYEKSGNLPKALSWFGNILSGTITNDKIRTETLSNISAIISKITKQNYGQFAETIEEIMLLYKCCHDQVQREVMNAGSRAGLKEIDSCLRMQIEKIEVLKPADRKEIKIL